MSQSSKSDISADPYNLIRFVQAQEDDYTQALLEAIRNETLENKAIGSVKFSKPDRIFARSRAFRQVSANLTAAKSLISPGKLPG